METIDKYPSEHGMERKIQSPSSLVIHSVVHHYSDNCALSPAGENVLKSVRLELP